MEGERPEDLYIPHQPPLKKRLPVGKAIAELGGEVTDLDDESGDDEGTTDDEI